MPFRTQDGIVVPAVTADQMREVDRIAVEEFGLGILQIETQSPYFSHAAQQQGRRSHAQETVHQVTQGLESHL
jgi:hypothetical protein